MSQNERLPKTQNHRRLTRQQEAFCRLVADGTPVTESVRSVYTSMTRPASCGSKLVKTAKVKARIDELVRQSEVIWELSRDSLTVEALDTTQDAREHKKFSASISGLRLAGDLQGLTTSNPVTEATNAFLAFLTSGDSGKPAVGDVQMLDS